MKKILDIILDAWEANEIAKDNHLSTEQEGAEMYFDNTYYESTWTESELPLYRQFVKKIEAGDLYYDYGADYYFVTANS